MLRASFLKHPSFAANSLATMARAAGHILWIYHRLASVARYQPSWPQLRRIVTCGQILILSWTLGDAQHAETKTLYEMFQRLLRIHMDRWPISRELGTAFSSVATLNGRCVRQSSCSSIVQAGQHCPCPPRVQRMPDPFWIRTPGRSGSPCWRVTLSQDEIAHVAFMLRNGFQIRWAKNAKSAT